MKHCCLSLPKIGLGHFKKLSCLLSAVLNRLFFPFPSKTMIKKSIMASQKSLHQTLIDHWSRYQIESSSVFQSAALSDVSCLLAHQLHADDSNGSSNV